jgi:H+/Cl- antiporter ClcA
MAGGQSQALGGRAYLRLVLLGALIGIPAATLAALFLAFVHDLEHWLWTDLPHSLGHSEPPWYLVVFLPVAGAVVVYVARRFLPGDGGHLPLEGLSADPTPPSHGAGVALAALGTLGFGAVLGPEAPLIALGSVAGVIFTRFAGHGERERRLLSSAGSFAAISALFGGPIVGGTMMVEAGAGGLGAALIPALLPGFVAAAVGYLIFTGFGHWGGLNAPGLVEPGLPAYHGVHVYDLLLAVAIGVLAAVLLAGIRRLGWSVAGVPGIGMGRLLLAGGLAVGLLAELADLLGASSQDVLFSGQASIPALVSSSTKIVFVLLAAKGLGYAISLGCGFRGGPIFPAIFVSVGLVALAVNWFDISPTLAVAVGAAAGMAAMTRLVLTPMLFGALLVGPNGVDAVPAAVLAAAAAWLAATALERRPPRAEQVRAAARSTAG